MQIIKDFTTSFGLFFDSLAFIRKHSLKAYLWLPLLISLVCLILTTWGAYMGAVLLTDRLSQWLLQLLGLSETELSGLVRFIINLFAVSTAIVTAILMYRLIASVVVLPFMGPLLDRLEIILTGQVIGTSLKTDIYNAVYGVGSGLRIAFYSLLILFVSFFIGPLQIPLNLGAQSYFLGRSSFDYIFEKSGHDLNSRKRLIQSSRYGILGNGCAYFIFLFLPVGGALLGPVFSLIAAVRWHYSSAQSNRP